MKIMNFFLDEGKLIFFSEVNVNILLLISFCYLNYLLDVFVISIFN